MLNNSLTFDLFDHLLLLIELFIESFTFHSLIVSESFLSYLVNDSSFLLLIESFVESFNFRSLNVSD